MRRTGSAATLLACALIVACGPRDPLANPPDRLSDLDLFVGDVHEHRPAPGVMPYDVTTPLFSDYSHKFRFIRLPRDGSTALPVVYDAEETFDLPVGTLLSKTFSYPVDARDADKGWRHLETRLLIRGAKGWGALTYVWNRGQQDGYLEVAGDDQVVSWIDGTGAVRVNDYMVPNTNQCAQCHNMNGEMVPIGVKARFLNKDFDYEDGTRNQLDHWRDHGMLDGLPDVSRTAGLAVWDDPATGSVKDRARAYLEANCAHCHSPGASAWNTGLDLRASTTDPSLLGVYKTASAAGRGTSDRRYDIVPGRPDASILLYRLISKEPDVAMPELARRDVDREGVALVRRWIEEMPEID